MNFKVCRVALLKWYLPQGESKMEELKRLDRCVQFSGTLEVLCAGIGGVLIFGLGNVSCDADT